MLRVQSLAIPVYASYLIINIMCIQMPLDLNQRKVCEAWRPVSSEGSANTGLLLFDFKIYFLIIIYDFTYDTIMMIIKLCAFLSTHKLWMLSVITNNWKFSQFQHCQGLLLKTVFIHNKTRLNSYYDGVKIRNSGTKIASATIIVWST